jgi:iron-sulfur cluster assembly protein
MNYAKNGEKFDEVIDEKGVKVIVDKKALMALVGTQMDFVEDDLKSEFVFTNPNSKVILSIQRYLFIIK